MRVQYLFLISITNVLIVYSAADKVCTISKFQVIKMGKQ